MKTRSIIAVALATLMLAFTAPPSNAESYKIGVLAKRGREKALKQWKATADYLTQKVEGASFEIVPLDFEEVMPAVQSESVAFFLVNSSMFVTAQVKYGATPIATMINSRQGKPLKSFGGVIITTADSDEINSLVDLKGKTFAAVKDSSFGGWQMAYKEILDAGVDPTRDTSDLVFSGKHDNVVYAVLNGEVDAGTVRTDTIERMAAEGLIDADELKVVNAKTYADFPFRVSTALYPEWPMGKVKGTADGVAKQVAQALTAMGSSEKAAKDAKVVGWSASLDYGPVRDLQERLAIGAYEGS